jgi:hypothetical protein
LPEAESQIIGFLLLCRRFLLGDAVNTTAAQGNIINRDLHDTPLREKLLECFSGFIVRANAITGHHDATIDKV